MHEATQKNLRHDLAAVYAVIRSRAFALDIDDVTMNQGIERLGTIYKSLAKEEFKKPEITAATDRMFVLIDDSDIVRRLWTVESKKYDINFKACVDLEEFAGHRIPKNAMIFVDKHLGNNKSGVELSRFLYERGYRNIYLTTGLPVESDSHHNFIQGIVGKEFPLKATESIKLGGVQNGKA